jgi:hypothetical protein
MGKRSSVASTGADLPMWLQVAFSVPPVGLMFASFGSLWFIGLGLARVLGIPDDVPVKEQPNGLLWLVLFFLSIAFLPLAGAMLGFSANAWIARSCLGWPWDAIRGSGACPRVLIDWLERREGASGRSKDLAKGEDRMHDAQLDDFIWPPLPLGGPGDPPGGWDE